MRENFYGMASSLVEVVSFLSNKCIVVRQGVLEEQEKRLFIISGVVQVFFSSANGTKKGFALISIFAFITTIQFKMRSKLSIFVFVVYTYVNTLYTFFRFCIKLELLCV